MTRVELIQKGKYLGERDIYGRLYSNAYEGSKKYYLLGGTVYCIADYLNRMEYMGDSTTEYVGELDDLIKEYKGYDDDFVDMLMRGYDK